MIDELTQHIDEDTKNKFLNHLNSIQRKEFALRRETTHLVKTVLRETLAYQYLSQRTHLVNWHNFQEKLNAERYGSHLYSESNQAYDKISNTPVSYDNSSEKVDGRIILRDNFDAILKQYPEALIFGEDVGKIGDVNQGVEGLQKKYGDKRVFDTGIRELAIIGKGYGMALRGLRPIAEIQYLDYILYGLQVLSDDVASLHYRTKGRQKVPMIVRTRGHRLEGIWHSGSPMSSILNLTRGIYLLVPRNMTQAAGMYNSLMKSDNPAIVIECLNAYRKKNSTLPTSESFL